MSSVLRVITRIIPLNGSESSFEPAAFEALTDGACPEVEIVHYTDPRTGLKYRIERVEQVQIVGPGETVEGVNNAFAEKLQSIPGFARLDENERQVNPHDQSLQVSVPQVVSLKDGKVESNETPLTVSVVENASFSDLISESLKPGCSRMLYKGNDKEVRDDEEPSKVLFKSKYPCSTRTRYRQKYRWRNRRKPVFNSRKLSKSYCSEIDSSWDQISEVSNHNDQTCDAEDNEEIDTEKTDVELPGQELLSIGKNFNLLDDVEDSSDETATLDKNTSDTTSEIVKQDFLYFSEAEDLIIDEPETLDFLLKSQQVDIADDNDDDSSSSSNTDSDQSSSSFEDNKKDSDKNISLDDQSYSQQASDSNTIEYVSNDIVCTKYVFQVGNPMYSCLDSLKKYFVSGECLICGFIPTDVDYNAAVHMESHISSNPSFSCYKCQCCNEKFCSPRSLYMHALSREKTYNYGCDTCLLKFKRKHYLSRHNTKAHLTSN